MTKIQISLSATKASVLGLEKLITRAAASYTNDGSFLKIDLSKWPNATRLLFDHNIRLTVSSTGLTTITDSLFDKMQDVLRAEAPTSTVLRAVGAPVKTATTPGAKAGRQAKVELKHYMGSLDKVKPGNADQWLLKNKGPYVISDKMDGISIQLNYVKGQLPTAFTRGNGAVGQNISKLVPYLKIPKRLKLDLDLRGEIIMSEAAFKGKWGGEFENARNMTAGVVNRTSMHSAVFDMDVVIYEVLSPRGQPSKQLKMLSDLGFHLVPHSTHLKLSSAALSEILTARKAKSAHAIDGLVVSLDKTTQLVEGSNPTHSVAFKETSDDNMAEVRVKEVVWAASKRGLLKPRVNIEPVRLSGVTINYATGHNAFFVVNGFRSKDKDKGLPIRPIGPGALIKITRSGDVIPHIISVIKPAKAAQMPDESYLWNKTGTDIVQAVGSKLSDTKRVTYFFSKLDVEGLKIGTVSKFFEAGLDSILKIVRATKEQFLAVDGIQERTAQKLRANIDKALATMTLPALMDASGMFGALGEKRLTLIVNKHPNILEYAGPNAELLSTVVDIPGFKATLAKQFVEGLPGFKTFYKRLGVKAIVPVVARVVRSGPMSGQTVVFTGFRDSQMEAAVQRLGGTIASAVNSKTTILCVKDSGAASSKIVKAKQLGIRVVTGDTFRLEIGKM